MSNDLLFSVLPRQGTVPIAHDEHIVEKVTKTTALRELSDKEQELHLEEREAREKQQSKHKKPAVAVQKDKPTEQETTDKDKTNAESDADKDNKGFKHLDIYV